MKQSETVKQLLADLSRMPTTGRIKVNADAVRELAQSDALNRAGVLAATSILAVLADRTPMAIEDRKNVETVLDTILAVQPGVDSVNAAIRALTEVVVQYQH